MTVADPIRPHRSPASARVPASGGRRRATSPRARTADAVLPPGVSPTSTASLWWPRVQQRCCGTLGAVPARRGRRGRYPGGGLMRHMPVRLGRGGGAAGLHGDGADGRRRDHGYLRVADGRRGRGAVVPGVHTRPCDGVEAMTSTSLMTQHISLYATWFRSLRTIVKRRSAPPQPSAEPRQTTKARPSSEGDARQAGGRHWSVSGRAEPLRRRPPCARPAPSFGRPPGKPSQDDDRAQDLSATHPGERRLHLVQGDLLADEGRQVEAASQIEIDQCGDVS